MKPIRVELKDGRLSWTHPARGPYVVYVRPFKESQYSVHTVTDQNSIPFDLTDVWVQIRPVGEQPSLEYGDDYCVFGEDRIHTPSLRLSYLRDVYRNQTPEQLTQRFSDWSNLTQLQDQMQLEQDRLQDKVASVFEWSRRYSRLEFTPQNSSQIPWLASEILAVEHDLYSDQVRNVRLRKVQSPNLPDAYVPVWFLNVDISGYFTTNFNFEDLDRTVVFEESGRCAVQFDYAHKSLSYITRSGSVVQRAILAEPGEALAFDLDSENVYCLFSYDPHTFSSLNQLDQALFDRFDIPQAPTLTCLVAFRKPQLCEETLEQSFRIYVHLKEKPIQMKVLHGQMLVLLEDGRVQVLEPRFYQYSELDNESVLHDTFQRVVLRWENLEAMQRVRKFKKLHTTTDDLLLLFGMSRSEAETVARQLTRMIIDLFENQHVSRRMFEQLYFDTPHEALTLSELEETLGSEVTRSLIRAGFVPTQPSFEKQILDQSSVTLKPAEQLVKTRYDSARLTDTFTSHGSKLVRPAHIFSQTPIQQFNPPVKIVKNVTSTVKTNFDRLWVFKPGTVTFEVQLEVLNLIAHITNVDGQYVSQQLAGKHLIMQRYPYDKLLVNGIECDRVGTINGTFCYQAPAEILKGEISVHGVIEGESVPLMQLDMKTLAFAVSNRYVHLSRPTQYFYIVQAGDES